MTNERPWRKRRIEAYLLRSRIRKFSVQCAVLSSCELLLLTFLFCASQADKPQAAKPSKHESVAATWQKSLLRLLSLLRLQSP
jgi:hypothetical protein